MPTSNRDYSLDSFLTRLDPDPAAVDRVRYRLRTSLELVTDEGGQALISKTIQDLPADGMDGVQLGRVFDRARRRTEGDIAEALVASAFNLTAQPQDAGPHVPASGGPEYPSLASDPNAATRDLSLDPSPEGGE